MVGTNKWKPVWFIGMLCLFTMQCISRVVILQCTPIYVLLFKYFMKDYYHATQWILWFEGLRVCSVWPSVLSFSLSVLPGLAERPQLMTLWSECSGSAGLFHTTLDRVFKHMNQRYTAMLQERHPHSADTGWIIPISFQQKSQKLHLKLHCLFATRSCFCVFIPCSSHLFGFNLVLFQLNH